MSVKAIVFRQSSKSDQLGILPVDPSMKIYWKQYKDQEARGWTNDIKVAPTLTRDKADWKKLKNKSKYMYTLQTRILLFFKCSDKFAGIISLSNILPYCDNVWTNAMFTLHARMEIVHNESYSLLADARFDDPKENEQMEKIALSIPSLKKMIDWAKDYTDDTANIPLTDRPDPYYFPKLLLKFICFEGVFFTPWFAVIYAVKAKGMFPALCSANEYIAQDEWYHVLNTIAVYMNLTERMPQDEVHKIFKEAVDITIEFLHDGMEEDVPEFDISKKDLIEYIKFVCNIIMKELLYDDLYPGAEMRLPFMKNKDLYTFASIHESNDPNYREAVSTGERIDPFSNDF